MKIKSKIWIEKDGELVFGTGKLLIIKAIRETGSINLAAKKVNMSYRHAWSYVNSIENRLGKPLFIRIKGGKGGGGTVLTKYGKYLLNKFEKLEYEVKNYADKKYRLYIKEES